MDEAGYSGKDNSTVILRTINNIVLVVVLGFAATQNLVAQYNVVHHQPASAKAGEMLKLDFMVTGISPNSLNEALLFYRFDGDISYRQKEMFYREGRFSGEINQIESSASEVEYYAIFNVDGGTSIYYPSTIHQSGPVRLLVTSPPRQVGDFLETDAFEYTILSPVSDEAVIGDKMLIAVALFYDEAKVGPGEFGLFVDGVDVSASAEIKPYYISYLAPNLRSGQHHLQLFYYSGPESYLISEWNAFTFSTEREAVSGITAGRGQGLQRPAGSIELSARNQSIGNDLNSAYSGRANLSGKIGDFRYSFNGFFTTQESRRLQPQNRFGVDLQYGEWWRFQAGHVYPTLSRFTISGNRIYGLDTEVHLLNQNINLKLIHGELQRKISNIYDGITREESIIAGNPVDTTYTLKFADGGRGTLRRLVTGGRLAFGNERRVQIGLQALRIQDDTTSVYNARTFSDIVGERPDLYSSFSTNDQNKLVLNPDLLVVESGALQAKGNFMMSTDARMSFAKNRIRVNSEGAVSLMNNDIYGGVLTAERADEMGFDLPGNSERILDKISKLIIINENMDVLPIKLSNITTDSASADLFLPLGLLASNSELIVNYPQNNFRLQYRWVGSDFNSLANSTIRRDVAGFTASDRFGILQNRLFVTLGYENLKDNLTGRKESTTKSATYSTNIGWYPVSDMLPKINLGFKYRSRDNGVERLNPSLPQYLQNKSVQNYKVVGTDTLLAITPRSNTSISFTGSATQQFTWIGFTHDVSINYSLLNTKDKGFYFGDINNSSFGLDFSTRYDRSLTTSVGFSVNNTVTGHGLSYLQIIGFFVGGNYFLPNQKMSFNAQFALTTNSNEVRTLETDIFLPGSTSAAYTYYKLSDSALKDAFNTYMLRAGAQYNINRFHLITASANITNVSGSNISGDRILRVSYIFNF